MNNFKLKSNDTFQCIYFMFLCSLFSVSFATGQGSTTTTDRNIRTVTMDVDSMEICFGYKILSCQHFKINRSGLYKKNKSVIEFDYDEKGRISHCELVFNNNYSLDSKDIIECILPYINLSTEIHLTRYDVRATNKIAIIFEGEIGEENERQHFINSLIRTKENAIHSYKEGRRLKSTDYILNVTKFNKLNIVEDVDSIFNLLEIQMTTLLNEYLLEYEKTEHQFERTTFSNNSQKTFSEKIYNGYITILNDYFERE